LEDFMDGAHFALSLIRTGCFTMRRACRRLSDKSFVAQEVADNPSMAWTLLHLAGQLEWATAMTLSHPSVQPIPLLEAFKGQTSDMAGANALMSKIPPRSDVEAIFDEASERAMQALESAGAKWDGPPADEKAALIFPTVAALWKHVGFHISWHLGHLAATYPALEGPLYTEPPIHGYEGSLK
jgi:uncharacterized damage-inducible protein DinB